MYFLMCYPSVQYLLNYNLLSRLAIVVLVGCCEFNPNVTCVRITPAHESPCHMLPGGFGQREVGMLRAAPANWEKFEG